MDGDDPGRIEPRREVPGVLVAPAERGEVEARRVGDRQRPVLSLGSGLVKRFS
jgi:hypothetical protein